jgi:hypothetical protein
VSYPPGRTTAHNAGSTSQAAKDGVMASLLINREAVTDHREGLVWEIDGRLPVWTHGCRPACSRAPNDARTVRSIIDDFGLVLVRGFDLLGEQFLRWVEDVCGGWGFTASAPSGVDPRSRLFTQSELEQNMHEPHRLQVLAEKRGATPSGGPRIELHSDNSAEPFMPAWTWFYVTKAADRGGETVLCDGASVVSALSDRTLSFLADDIIYRWRSSTMPGPGKTPVVSDPPGMDRQYRRLVVEQADGTFEIVAIARPIIRSRVSGHRVFANRILGTLDENGGDAPPGRTVIVHARTQERKPLPHTVIRELHDVASALSFSVLLRDKEMLCVDNTRFMHGREAYEGSRHVMFHMRFHPSQLSTSHDGALV